MKTGKEYESMKNCVNWLKRKICKRPRNVHRVIRNHLWKIEGN